MEVLGSAMLLKSSTERCGSAVLMVTDSDAPEHPGLRGRVHRLGGVLEQVQLLVEPRMIRLHLLPTVIAVTLLSTGPFPSSELAGPVRMQPPVHEGHGAAQRCC